MPVIRVFEPALCCNTGVCGPQLDQELVDFTAAVSEPVSYTHLTLPTNREV